MKCYGVLGIFNFGNCKPKDPQRPSFNLSLEASTKQINNSVSKTNQVEKTSVLASQIQRVTINGYDAGAGDIVISQDMNIKVASKSKLSAIISEDMLKGIADNMGKQFDGILNSANDISKNPKNKDLVTNMKKTVYNILTSDSSRRSIQQKVTNTISVQNQEIYINLAPRVSTLIQDTTVKSTGVDGRPIIKITQSLVDNILTETTMKSVIGEIINNDDFVKLAKDIGENIEGKKAINSIKLSRLIKSTSEKVKEDFTKYYIGILIVVFFFFSFFFIKNKRCLVMERLYSSHLAIVQAKQLQPVI